MSHTGCQRNEEHEDGAFGVAIANCGRDGGKPFLGVSLDAELVKLDWYTFRYTDIEFILDDLVVV